MARLKNAMQKLNCKKDCPGHEWTNNNKVTCQGYCRNSFHDICIGMSYQEAMRTEWFCEDCAARRNELEARSVNSQDVLNVNSQELRPLAEEADRIFRNVPIDMGGNSQNSARTSPRNSHIQQMQQLASDTDPIEDFDELDTHGNGENDASVGPNQRARSSQTRNSTPRELVASTSSAIIETNNSSPISNEDSDSTGEVASQKGAQEYWVEDILAHGIADDGTLLYKVRWTGYGPNDDTWEPESQFKNLYDVLAKYKRINNLGLPTFKKNYGNTKQQKGNFANWVDAERIIDTAIGFIPKQNRDKIPMRLICYPEKLDNTDHLYLIDYENHALVGLFYANRNLMIICDGENIYQNDFEARKFFDKWFRITIKPITFLYQVKVDYCASSAAILLYKLAEIYARGAEVTNPITISHERHKKMKKLFHAEHSNPLKSWTPIRQQPTYKCDHANCSFVTTKKDPRVMRAHQLSHKKRAI